MINLFLKVVGFVKKLTKDEERELQELGKKLEEYSCKLEQAKTLEEAKYYLQKVKEARQAREQYNEYYYWLRGIYEQSFLHNLSVEQKKKLFPTLYRLIKTKDVTFGGLSYEVIGDKRVPTHRPKIFAITHIGKFDVEIASLALKEHYYLLSGDFENVHDTFEASILKFNGVVYVKEDDWQDRSLAKEKMKKILLSGGNMMFFPEGSWNLKPNLPVLPIFRGIIEVAMATNAIIVPVAIEQYGKHFKVNIGENFDVRNELFRLYNSFYENYEMEKRENQKIILDNIKNIFRDVLATLKMEIYATETLSEEERDGKAFQESIDKKVSEWTNTLEEFETHIFRPKGYVTAEEVFKPLDNVEPTLENAKVITKTRNPKN